MTGKVTESIYNGKSIIVPLADVQHIETHNPGGLIVVTKHTRWDSDSGTWANNVWVDGAEADAFKMAWCHYRSELEAECDICKTLRMEIERLQQAKRAALAVADERSKENVALRMEIGAAHHRLRAGTKSWIPTTPGSPTTHSTELLTVSTAKVLCEPGN